MKPGQSTLAFYTAHNLSDVSITGVSTYNVSPMKVGDANHMLTSMLSRPLIYICKYTNITRTQTYVYKFTIITRIQTNVRVLLAYRRIYTNVQICHVWSHYTRCLFFSFHVGCIQNFNGFWHLILMEDSGYMKCISEKVKVINDMGDTQVVNDLYQQLWRYWLDYKSAIVSCKEEGCYLLIYDWCDLVQAGAYFNKIQCFCFEEQRLRPHEKIDMPVSNGNVTHFLSHNTPTFSDKGRK